MLWPAKHGGGVMTQRFAGTLACVLLVGFLAAPSVTLGGDAGAMPEGRPRIGMQLYQMQMCHSCHSLQGLRRKGPHLYGVVGREAGSLDNYDYSGDLAEADFVWTEETLFAFLENPKRMFPDTKMSWPGMHDAQKRADIVAFLKAYAEQRRN